MSTRRSSRKKSDSAEARVVAIASAKRGATSPEPLGPGAHFARLHRVVPGEARFEAVVFGRGPLAVGLAPEVDAELAAECLASQEVVLVGMLDGEPVVFGALRTKAAKPDAVVVEAPEKLVLRAGRSKLELRADGRVKLSADDVTLDAPHEIRLASARVEIP